MSPSRKTIAVAVSMTLMLTLGAILWIATPNQQKVIELPPVQGGQK